MYQSRLAVAHVGFAILTVIDFGNFLNNHEVSYASNISVHVGLYTGWAN